jgi:hypothetical protein
VHPPADARDGCCAVALAELVAGGGGCGIDRQQQQQLTWQVSLPGLAYNDRIGVNFDQQDNSNYKINHFYSKVAF